MTEHLRADGSMSKVNLDDGVDGFRTLLISHIDNAGISRVKAIPSTQISSALTKGSSVSLSLGMLLAIDDHANSTDAIDPTIGDLRGMPDASAIAVLDRSRGLAWAPSYLYGLDGLPHPTCQRSTLKRITEAAGEEGFQFLVGMELEFTLFRGSKAQPELAHTGPGYGTRAFLELEDWHLDLLDALEDAGVPVEQLHPEYENGQIEVSLAPRGPVRAVDDYVLARLIVTRTALRHGFLVSFAPVAIVGGVANGCHIHLSASRDGQNVFYDDSSASGMTTDAGHMIAGILDHLVDGLALLGGSTLSFERLKPHNWAGAYACWGPSNREAAVRYMRGQKGHGAAASNIEVKCADPAANHYLAVAALIGAAIDGVGRRLPLPEGIVVDPAELSDEERAAAAVERFPDTLGAALDRYEKSTFFRELLGPMLFYSYLVVRRHEWERFGDLEPEDVAREVRWRF